MAEVIACVVNPARKRSEPAWHLVQQHCAALGFAPPRRFDTTIEHPGELQARQALEAGATSVVVIGGDGTVRNVSNALIHSGVPLGIIPAGTANIFHLNAVGKLRSMDRAVRTALLGEEQVVDTGLVRLTFDGGVEQTHRFLVVVGAGYDAESLRGVSVPVKQRFGPLAYFLSGARQLRKPRHNFDLELDGAADSVDAWCVLIGNCGVVPGGITILPNANLQDAKLNTLVLSPSSIVSWAPIAWRAWRGSDRSLKVAQDDVATEVTVQSERPVFVQVDGDVWSDVLALRAEMDPASLIVRTRSDMAHESE